MQRRSLIFVVISVLVVALIYSSPNTFYVFAAPPSFYFGSENSNCVNSPETLTATCCWPEYSTPEGEGGPEVEQQYCQTCSINTDTGDFENCNSPQPVGMTAPPTSGQKVIPGDIEVLEQPPTPPPSGPAAPLQEGVLEQPPSEGVIPPLKQGRGVLPQDGVLEQQPADQGAAEPPADEGTEPTPETLPICRGGQVLDEESGLCVLEEPKQPEAEEPEVAEELPAEERE